MKSEHFEIRVWATQLVTGDDQERRAAGRAILMLLDDLARMDAELASARNDASQTRAELELAGRQAAEAAIAEQAAAEVAATPPSWRDRFVRRTRQ